MLKSNPKQTSHTALLIIDMLNTLDFPEGKKIFKPALRAAQKISLLRQSAVSRKIPVIYVNDNFGHWKSDWNKVFKVCVHDSSLGAPIARLLKPIQSDYRILKPKNSGFYSTCLEILLKSLEVEKLVITGIAGNICVFFTAHDAHMRGYKVIVPADCIASNSAHENTFAISQLRDVFNVETPKARSLVGKW